MKNLLLLFALVSFLFVGCAGSGTANKPAEKAEEIIENEVEAIEEVAEDVADAVEAEAEEVFDAEEEDVEETEE